MKYYIGVDQGSSKTTAVIFNQLGQILSIGNAPGGYHYRDGLDRQIQTIHAAVQSALEQVPGIALPLAGLYAGLTGVDWPEDQDLLLRGVRSLSLAIQVNVVGDMFIAFRGGSATKSGVILIAGTGANCAITTPSGKQFAFNFYVEPEIQGGRALGRSALSAIYLAATNRAPRTQLTGEVLDFYTLESVDRLLKLDVENKLPVRIDKLAPLVFNACDAGDEVACQIVSTFAIGLANLVTSGIQCFVMQTLPVEVVTSGSIFKTRSQLFHTTLEQEILKVAPNASLIPAKYEPVVGSVMLALEADDISITGDVLKNIEITSQQLGLVRVAS